MSQESKQEKEAFRWRIQTYYSDQLHNRPVQCCNRPAPTLLLIEKWNTTNKNRSTHYNPAPPTREKIQPQDLQLEPRATVKCGPDQMWTSCLREGRECHQVIPLTTHEIPSLTFSKPSSKIVHNGSVDRVQVWKPESPACSSSNSLMASLGGQERARPSWSLAESQNAQPDSGLVSVCLFPLNRKHIPWSWQGSPDQELKWDTM